MFCFSGGVSLLSQMLYALAPRSHDGNSMSYLNHGCECHASGDYEQAIELYVKALNVRLQFFGANSLPVGQVYSLVAHTLHAAGEIDDAEEYYAKSLDIRADMLRSLEQKGLGGDFLPLQTVQNAVEYNNCAPLTPAVIRGPGGVAELMSPEVAAAALASVNNDMPSEMYSGPHHLIVIAVVMTILQVPGHTRLGSRTRSHTRRHEL